MGSRVVSLLFLLVLLLSLFSTFIYLEIEASGLNSEMGCTEMEKEALLKFKQGLEDPLGRLASWVGKNCCNWTGVDCSNETGHVIKLDLRSMYDCSEVGISSAALYRFCQVGGMLNPSLLNLTYLSYLDLSWNNFQGIPIPDFIGSFKNLMYLDLSRANFSGIVPSHLGNLSNLVHLDLSFNSESLVSDLNWLSRLSFLNYLNLGLVNLTKASNVWPQVINMLPSLMELHLYGCQLANIAQPLPFVNFTSLLVLDLSHNYFSSSIPQWISNISSITILDLSVSGFQGSISSVSWGNLCNLQNLDLSYNNFTGEINEHIGALSQCGNSSLETLNLDSNQFRGNLPESLGNLRRLGILDLSFNKLSGSIPENIAQLTDLYILDLEGNSWEGIITEVHFQNLSRLTSLSLSSASKSLVFKLRPDWVPSFSLSYISISDCQLGPAFPTWLSTQKDVINIKLSSCAISESIPDWFWTLSPKLWWLDLSDNQLRVKLPNEISFGYNSGGLWICLGFNNFEGPIPLWSNVTYLSLRNNFFSGPIPSNIGYEMPQLQTLDLSRNYLNGSIPLSMNKMGNLRFLDLSSNNLSGAIPRRWKGLQSLMSLDLSNNNLSGGIPGSICSSTSLFWLKLGRNRLSGQLSTSLKGCWHLFVVDLGDNRFSGTISDLIADNLLSLSYLGLRGNLLTGGIPDQLCRFPNLYILDLAHNNLSGTIPRCIGSLKAFRYQGFYLGDRVKGLVLLSSFEHVELVVMGRQREYTEMSSLVKYIDLSSNSLSGEIPEGITNLTYLYALNLSWNQLGGKIPENIGSLKWLESLDLSHNHLSGPIPPTMTSMTFLHDLDLSFNNLSGQIPISNQFQTFNDPSIYVGNPALCGPPLTEGCSSTITDFGKTDGNDGRSDHEDRFEKLWFYTSMGVGFATGFWAVCGSLVIKQSWRRAYFKFVDEMKDRLLTFVALKMAHFCRNPVV